MTNYPTFRYLQNLDGFLSEDAYSLFQSLNHASELKGSILEIGVFCGRSLMGLALAFPKANKIIGVDPFFENFEESPALPGEGEHLALTSHHANSTNRMQGIHQLADIIDSETQSQVSDKIQLIRTTQDEYLAKKKQSTKHAICHVDGEHTFEAVVKLLDALPNLMKQDGLIIIDDILNLGYPGIAEAVYTHPNFKKSFFPIIYAFNKGVFIYGTSEKSRQSLIHTLNNQLKNKSYTIRKLHDQSLMVYHAAPATPSPSSTKKLIMRIISIFQ